MLQEEKSSNSWLVATNVESINSFQEELQQPNDQPATRWKRGTNPRSNPHLFTSKSSPFLLNHGGHVKMSHEMPRTMLVGCPRFTVQLCLHPCERANPWSWMFTFTSRATGNCPFPGCHEVSAPSKPRKRLPSRERN